MRPRHKAAENVGEVCGSVRSRVASMRPRHKAAENFGWRLNFVQPVRPASMRPRHKAAENFLKSSLGTRTGHCFNEAAA